MFTNTSWQEDSFYHHHLPMRQRQNDSVSTQGSCTVEALLSGLTPLSPLASRQMRLPGNGIEVAQGRVSTVICRESLLSVSMNIRFPQGLCVLWVWQMIQVRIFISSGTDGYNLNSMQYRKETAQSKLFQVLLSFSFFSSRPKPAVGLYK